MATREENIARFKELMGKVDREGKDALMEYIEKTDFYTAPASTRFHLSCEGGLLQHSLNVYDCLAAKRTSSVWEKVFGEIPEESLIIMALLHDLCKINFYSKTTKNQKCYDPEVVNSSPTYQRKSDSMGEYVWQTVPSYEVNDFMPLGHGEKSVMLINCFMKLKTAELFAIRWHMGFSVPKEDYNALGTAMEKYPVVLALHEADMEATKLLETK